MRGRAVGLSLLVLRVAVLANTAPFVNADRTGHDARLRRIDNWRANSSASEARAAIRRYHRHRKRGLFDLKPRSQWKRLPPPPKPPPPPPAKPADCNARREAVREAFHHSWQGYENHAWGYDELTPLDKGWTDVWGGFAVTMVDGLDTAYLMGFTEEFERAVRWMDANLTAQRDHHANVFEITIRVLGGLLSAYDLSGDARLLKKAEEFGHALVGAFDRDGGGLPSSELNIKRGVRSDHPWARGQINLAEAGSVQMELARLVAILGTAGSGTDGKAVGGRAGSWRVAPQLATAARSTRVLLAMESETGLYDRSLGKGKLYSVNGGSDSFYEYLLKIWVLRGGTDSELWHAYVKAVGGISSRLVRRDRGGQTYIGEEHQGRFIPYMEHLACFAPGMLALGVMRGSDSVAHHAQLARELMDTCWRLYADAPTGLAPDSIVFATLEHHRAGYGYAIKNGKYSLRPETVESLFLLWRLTHNETYREWGWRIFEALQRHCRNPAGFAGLGDVRIGTQENSMPSYWMAETLKYLFLLFSEDTLVPLDTWVFNTEAHPFRIARGATGKRPSSSSKRAVETEL